MSRKLVRNMSTKESRDWWNAVLAAAASAPKVDLEPKPYGTSTSRAGGAKPSVASRREAKKEP